MNPCAQRAEGVAPSQSRAARDNSLPDSGAPAADREKAP
jgi:hypothetical protein